MTAIHPFIPAVYTSTDDAWNAMLRACEDARYTIDLEEFILAPDTIGAVFIEVLSRKAKAGVRVRVILDGYGCRAFANSVMRRDAERAGVDIQIFRPVSFGMLFKTPGFFPRDHRKMLIIDNELTFIGGVCIYDDITGWRDTMLELSGGLTKQCLHIFERTRQKICGDETHITAHPEFETCDDLSIYANAPDSGEHYFTDELIQRITGATTHIRLSTPYFTPGRLLLPALHAALNRGVEVDIMLSDYSKYAPYVVGKKLCGALIRAGARVHYYQPVMLHLKMMVVDDTWAAIGSCNLDGLSIRQNQEAMLTSVNEDVIAMLDGHFQNDMRYCDAFTYKAWTQRPLSEKLSGAALTPFRRVL